MRKHLLYIGVVVAAVVLMALPLFRFELRKGHDIDFYPTRMVEFHFLLQQRVWFPTWGPHLSFGHGTPFYTFSPPMPYYTYSLFAGLGAGIVASMELTCVAVLLVGALGMYLLMLDKVGRIGATFSAVAYVTGPYLLLDLYVRAALGEFTAFASIPFVFWSIGRCAGKDWRVRHFVLGAVSVAALMLSHNFISFITLPAAGVYSGSRKSFLK